MATGPAQESADENAQRMVRLGRVIRASREGRMTVEELAEHAGVSGGLISQLERGIGNPSFNTLLRLSRALDLPISGLFQGVEYEPARMVVRKDERRQLTITSDGVKHEILTPDMYRKIGLVRSVIPAGYDSTDSPMSHQGEEVFLVIKGTLEVVVGGQTFRLATGDSITFDSTIPHAVNNPSSRVAELLGCSTPPTTAGCY
ncbi:MAG: helix-turn-helix transcriptional regulator [Nocardioidaceae bacterium]|nr:helix-turn-helix transcriptional regulator [Nocardioidaceae bacterium]